MSAREMERQRIASLRDRKRWAREIEERERLLRGSLVVPTNKRIGAAEGVPEREMSRLMRHIDRDIQEDPGDIMRDIRRRKRALAAMSPHVLDRKEKERLDRQRKQDEEFLKKHMMTRKRMGLKPGHPDFDKAINECVDKEHAPQFKKVAKRYQQTMRQLDQENPDAGNIERLRR